MSNINWDAELDQLSDSLNRTMKLAAVGYAAANDELPPEYLVHQFATIEENLTAIFDNLQWLHAQVAAEKPQPTQESIDRGEAPDWEALDEKLDEQPAELEAA